VIMYLGCFGRDRRKWNPSLIAVPSPILRGLLNNFMFLYLRFSSLTMFWVPSGLESSMTTSVESSFKFSIVWIMSAMFSASQYVGRIIATSGLVFILVLLTGSSAC